MYVPFCKKTESRLDSEVILESLGAFWKLDLLVVEWGTFCCSEVAGIDNTGRTVLAPRKSQEENVRDDSVTATVATPPAAHVN